LRNRIEEQVLCQLPIPLDHRRYHPDRDEPVDRWFQTANASNARTTVDIVKRVVREPPTFVIDPFAGGGSTASAARILGLPFFGIEIDPVLACVSLAKAEGRTRHVRLLEGFPGVYDSTRLTKALADISIHCAPADVPVVSALAILARLRTMRHGWLGTDELASDLAIRETVAPVGKIVRGDATSGASWEALHLPDSSAVLYCSPPFGETSPVLDAPTSLTAAARDVLAAAGADTLENTEKQFTSYAETTIGMLYRAAERLRHATLVIEHEPADDGLDSTEAVVERTRAELSGIVHRPRVVVCGEFSWRGPLSLIIFDLG
jgi:hypothetical protein